MVRYPATREETREESVPNTPDPVDISTEVMRKHGTHISPHKPILCRGLCGEGACVTVAVAMDHPSRGFHFPSQVDNIHGDTVPYGWGKCQMEDTNFHLHNHPANKWLGQENGPGGNGCNRLCLSRKCGSVSSVSLRDDLVECIGPT